MKQQDLNADGLLDPRFLEKSYQEALELTRAVARYLEAENEHLGDNDVVGDKEVFYASESMRVSSCLMQVMSWFLIQKGLAAGEVTKEQAAASQYRLGAAEICLEEVDTSKGSLPEQFIQYLYLSQNLYRQVARMDEMVYGVKETVNPVHELISKIQDNDTTD